MKVEDVNRCAAAGSDVKRTLEDARRLRLPLPDLTP
jgi:hypothetical protein